MQQWHHIPEGRTKPSNTGRGAFNSRTSKRKASARARQRETDKAHGTGEKGAEDHESTAALRPCPCPVLSCCCVLPTMTATTFFPGRPANDTSLVSNNNVAQLNDVDTTLIDIRHRSEEEVAIVCGTKRTRDTRGWADKQATDTSCRSGQWGQTGCRAGTEDATSGH